MQGRAGASGSWRACGAVRGRRQNIAALFGIGNGRLVRFPLCGVCFWENKNDRAVFVCFFFLFFLLLAFFLLLFFLCYADPGRLSLEPGPVSRCHCGSVLVPQSCCIRRRLLMRCRRNVCRDGVTCFGRACVGKTGWLGPLAAFCRPVFPFFSLWNCLFFSFLFFFFIFSLFFAEYSILPIFIISVFVVVWFSAIFFIIFSAFSFRVL